MSLVFPYIYSELVTVLSLLLSVTILLKVFCLVGNTPGFFSVGVGSSTINKISHISLPRVKYWHNINGTQKNLPRAYLKLVDKMLQKTLVKNLGHLLG